MTTVPDQFVHLHVHTCYSLLDGIIRPDDLVARAVEYKMPAVAITDHGTMFGVIQFYMEAVRAGIKPIIGCECYVAPRTIADKTPADHAGLSHLVLLAETMEGYRNLCRLATIAQQDGFFHKPRIDKALLQKHAKGLIGLSACLKGEIPHLICRGRQDEADAAARQYCDMLGDRNFFLEVQNNGLPEQETVNNALLDMSRRLSIPLVGTNDCHYLDPEDSRAHEIALCLQTGQTIHDTDRLKFDTNQLNFKSTGEMCVFLEPFPRAAANTVAIAERCQVAFDFSARHFPVLETPPGKTMADMLEDSAMAGLKKRWQHICKQSSHADKSVYQQRLAYELAVINEMGAPGYFLIIADFIAYAKNNGILTGPGRGSAPGSLVCYCLGITGVDPIEHGLLFERFLNPERNVMPDIDVDICINGREKIHQYLMDKYNRDDGEDYAACIATLGTMRSRAALREVGRALIMPLDDVNKVAKLIPPGARSLDDALKKEPALRALIDSKPEFGELMDVIRKLEGLPFHILMNAAGIVLSDKPLTCYTPLYRFKGEMITQLDARSLETMGLARLDLLGMRDLTVISDTLQLIKNQGRQTPDLSRIDTTDAATCQLLSKGDTFGVFQLASTGMKELLVKARPRSLSEVAVLIALYRPGLLENGMVADYLGRKQGLKDTTYPTAKLEPILKETCGLPVYQEQIMQAVQVLAGYTPGQSDDFRKAMGKRIAEKIADHRQRFINGAAAKGIDKATALQLFEQLEYFGAYGFNKAHSIAYAFIAWQMACLKAHFPAEFMAVWLDISFGCVDRIARLIGECRDSNIPVLPPDVNQSARQFTVVNGQIRCGLACVKKTDKGLIDAIIAERTAAGPFVSLSDFCNRMSAGRPELLQDRKALENLVKAGAFDSTGATRSQMMAVLDEILKPSLDLQQPRKPAVPALPEVGEWSPHLRRALEKRAMGICLTPAPPAYCHAKLKRPTTTPCAPFTKILKAAGSLSMVSGKRLSISRAKMGVPWPWRSWKTTMRQSKSSFRLKFTSLPGTPCCRAGRSSWKVAMNVMKLE